MNDRYLFRAKHVHAFDVNKKHDGWVYGYLSDDNYICDIERGVKKLIDPDTICQCTGLKDKNGKLIWENDITKLVLSYGEVRYFKVSFKKVVRKVLCHPGFYGDVAKVELNAICFEWNGYELFPCIDEGGISDVSKTKVVGNIFDNPELLEDK